MKYIILELSNDNVGEDSSWYADTDGKVYDTFDKARESMILRATEETDFLNRHSGEDVLYTLGRVEDEDGHYNTEIEIWREDDNGRGIYIPTGLITRFSIKGVVD